MLYRRIHFSLFLGLLAAFPTWADGRALLEEVTQTLQAQDAMSFDAQISSVFETSRGKSESALDVSFVLKGDKQVHIISRSADDEAAVISDGQTRVVHFVTKKQYASDPAPADRSKVLSLIGGGPIRVGSSWLAELLEGHAALTEKLTAAESAGVVALPNAEGTQARLLNLTYDTYDVALYLDETDPPLPRRIEIDLTRQYQGQTPGASASLLVMSDLSNWNLTPDAPDELFAWVKPRRRDQVSTRPAYAPRQRRIRFPRGDRARLHPALARRQQSDALRPQGRRRRATRFLGHLVRALPYGHARRRRGRQEV